MTAEERAHLFMARRGVLNKGAEFYLIGEFTAAAREARAAALEEAREEIAAHPEDHILLPNVSFGLIGIDKARDRIRALAERGL